MEGGASLSPSELHDVIQWDVETWQRVLPHWRSVIEASSPHRALAVGERQGGLSLWLANQAIDVLCTDVEEFGPATRALHERYGVTQRIRYRTEDVSELSLDDSSFDLVIFKSVLGALGTRERQLRAVAEIHRVLRPGGALLFAENLRGTSVHGWLRRRHVRWASGWRYLTYPDDLALFGAFGRVDTRTTGLLATLGRTEAQRDALAKLDALVCAWVPPRWHYVLYGSCIKSD